MSNLMTTSFTAVDLDALARFEGRIALVVASDGKLDAGARRVNRLTKGAVARVIEAGKLQDAKAGKVVTLNFPAGLAATAVDILCLDRRPNALDARKAGASFGKLIGQGGALLVAGSNAKTVQIALGAMMRAYDFNPHKTSVDDKARNLSVMCAKAEELETEAATLRAIVEGAHMTRDLINEPANVLTTTEFADRLKEMERLGLEVEVLEDSELETLGMSTLLCVGQGSDSPSKVVVMQWKGGAPLSLYPHLSSRLRKQRCLPWPVAPTRCERPPRCGTHTATASSPGSAQ